MTSDTSQPFENFEDDCVFRTVATDGAPPGKSHVTWPILTNQQEMRDMDAQPFIIDIKMPSEAPVLPTQTEKPHHYT